MEMQMSCKHKCVLAVITVGFSLVTSAGVFFLISAGLTDPAWKILGSLGLGLGLLLLIIGIVAWLFTIRSATRRGRWKHSSREEAEAFSVNNSDD